MLAGGAFTVLLLFPVLALTAGVPPPANVTVRCENQEVTASWDDEHQQPDSRYKVTIQRSQGFDEIETSDLHYNLTKHIWESEDRYMDSFHVAVRVLLGGKQSEPALSKTLSFYDLQTVHIKCALDFPPVSVKLWGLTATVTVKNPSRIYTGLKTSEDPQFEYSVHPVINGTELQESHVKLCRAKDEFCKVDINIMEGEETCLVLKGFWFDKSGIKLLKFKDSGTICPTEEHGEKVIATALIVSAIFILIITVVAILICKAKAWINKKPDLPDLLKPKPNNHNVMYNAVSGEEVCPVSVLEREEDVGPFENLQSSGVSSGSSASDRCLYPGQQLSDSSNQELGYEGNQTDDDNGSTDDSVQTEVVSVESEEEEPGSISPYDCPHMRVDLCVDMGNGEFATGYTGE